VQLLPLRGHEENECNKKKTSESLAAAASARQEKRSGKNKFASIAEILVSNEKYPTSTQSFAPTSGGTYKTPKITHEQVTVHEASAQVKKALAAVGVHGVAESRCIWVIDSGATSHMTASREVFSDYQLLQLSHSRTKPSPLVLFEGLSSSIHSYKALLTSLLSTTSFTCRNLGETSSPFRAQLRLETCSQATKLQSISLRLLERTYSLDIILATSTTYSRVLPTQNQQTQLWKKTSGTYVLATLEFNLFATWLNPVLSLSNWTQLRGSTIASLAPL
jgi:hypothetical protein